MWKCRGTQEAVDLLMKEASKLNKSRAPAGNQRIKSDVTKALDKLVHVIEALI